MRSYLGFAISHPASGLAISPWMRAFRAQLLRGDFGAETLTGASTATGRPRRVMVMGFPNRSISLRQARHLALNSGSLKVCSFIP